VDRDTPNPLASIVVIIIAVILIYVFLVRNSKFMEWLQGLGNVKTGVTVAATHVNDQNLSELIS
jgi:hypothetical protein